MATFPLTPLPPSLDRSPQLKMLAGLRGARFWILPIGMLCLVIFVVVALALTDPTTRTYIIGGVLFLSMILALVSTLVVGWRSPRGRAKWAWGCIALALASYVTAEIITVVLFGNQTNAPVTSISDALFLPFYPLLVAGVLLLPPQGNTDVSQLRAFLDAGIAIGALLAPALVFLIVPRATSGTTVDAVFIAYPVGDFIVLTALIVLLIRGVQQIYRPTFFWLAVGMICFSIADSAFNYLTLPGSTNTYAVGTPGVDPFWLAGAFAFCLAPLQLLAQGSEHGSGWEWLDRFSGRTTAPAAIHPRRYFILLAAPAAILFGLLLYTQVVQQSSHLPLIWVTLLVVLLIIIRQILTLRDLTDARIATERARQLEDAKDQFIASVNHELRTPIMTVHGLLEIIERLQTMRTSPLEQEAERTVVWAQGVVEKTRDNLVAEARHLPVPHGDIMVEDLGKAVQVCSDLLQSTKKERQAEQRLPRVIEAAMQASQALIQTTTNILDVRNIDLTKSIVAPRLVHVREIVITAWSLLDQSAFTQEVTRELLLQVPSSLCIWGDPGYFQQIVTNLLTNALKYSPAGTPISIMAYPVGNKGERGRIDTSKRHQIEMLVKDQGLGIPPEQIPLLFHRFVRLPRDLASHIRGTGLGLHLCQVFTEAMGGRIWVESTGTPGEGSTFYLRLPAPPPSLHQDQRDVQRPANLPVGSVSTPEPERVGGGYRGY